MKKLKFKNFSATAKVYDGKEILDKSDLFEVSVVDTKPRVKKYRRTQATALKRISNDMIKILEKVKQKKYTEKEIVEALHREKVLEKKRQIMLAKFDSDWDKLVAYQVRDMVVTHNKNKVYISIGNILRQLLP